METRTQFTFYESFAKALKRIRKAADRAVAYDAICDYALYGIEPDLDALPDAAAIAFDLIRPNLDSAKRKSEGGKKPRSKDEDSGKIPERYEEDNGNKKESKKEKEIEKKKENEIENENECYPPNPLSGGDPALSAVMSAYLGKVNPSASQTSLEELKAYVKAMGKDVCLRAIDIALDEKKAQWAYIRAILRRWQSKGVKCLADVERLEREHEAEKEKKNQPISPPKAKDVKASMEIMRKALEGKLDG